MDEVAADRINKENKQFMKLQKLRENQRSHRVIEDDYTAEFGDIGGSSPTNRMVPPIARKHHKYGAKGQRASRKLSIK